MADAVAGLRLVKRMKRVVGDWTAAGQCPMNLSPGDVADLLAHVDRALMSRLQPPRSFFVQEAVERGERVVAEMRAMETGAVLERADVVGVVAYVFPLEMAACLTTFGASAES